MTIETRHLMPELTGIYQLAPLIEARIKELDETIGSSGDAP